jgi:hypothetical protein
LFLLIVFQKISRGIGNPPDSSRRAYIGNPARITALAQFLFHLEIKRAVAKRIASFGAFPAAVAQTFVYGVFEIRVFYIRTPDGAGGTHQIFGRGIEVFHIIAIIPSAQIAIAAYPVGMDTLYGRDGQNAMGFAPSAKGAFVRVYLPEARGVLQGQASEGYGRYGNGRRSRHRCSAHTQKFLPGDKVVLIFFLFFHSLQSYKM